MNIGGETGIYPGQMELKVADFERVRSLIDRYCGINLHEGKQALVRARLMKRIRKLGMSSFEEYLDYVETDESGEEFLSFVDVLTTNKTSFFRESQHFDFIRQIVIPQLGGRQVKWWSAGCSTGEEPATLAITILDAIGEARTDPVKILATDISGEALAKAKTGIYSSSNLAGVPDSVRKRYFRKVGETEEYKLEDSIQKKITFGRLNLLKPWPMKGPFQLIMCRNVMIYFKRPTQQQIVSRFYDLLEPGGYLFLGHSENLPDKGIGLTSLQPAVYQK